MFLFAVGSASDRSSSGDRQRRAPANRLFPGRARIVSGRPDPVCLVAGLDLGYAAGLYAGSQTISAAIGVASDQIERLGLTPAEAKRRRRRHSNRLCRHLHLRHDWVCDSARPARPEADRRRPAGGLPRIRTASRRWDRRARSGRLLGVPRDRATGVPHRGGLRHDRPARARSVPGFRIFVERVRRRDTMFDAEPTRSSCPVMWSRSRGLRGAGRARRIRDPRGARPGLLHVPATAIDIFVTSKAMSGITLRQLADQPFARGRVSPADHPEHGGAADSSRDGSAAGRHPLGCGRRRATLTQPCRPWAMRIDPWKRPIW